MRWPRKLLCLVMLLLQSTLPVFSQPVVNSTSQKEPIVNSVAIPQQILRTGVSLNTTGLSHNTVQLANTIGLTPILQSIQPLRSRIKASEGSPSLEILSARQDLWDYRQKAALIIQKTDLEIDFTLAEINAELQVYNEILSTFTGDRDKLLARINAASFMSNGALWAVCEGLDIPTYARPRYSVSSGTVGILAGIVPSVASMYTLKAVNGKKKTSEVEPNMLAKLFGYPTTIDIEYPNSVWQFINQVPADEAKGKKRLDQLVDRWISDSNISSFTDRSSRKQLDVLTASVAQPKGLSINTLTARQVMLQQLSSEIMKMKRMLLELTMTLDGEKELTASEPTLEKSLPHIGMKESPINRLLGDSLRQLQ